MKTYYMNPNPCEIVETKGGAPMTKYKDNPEWGEALTVIEVDPIIRTG